MEPTKLSNHTFKKGVFITPINKIPNLNILNDEDSWSYGRLPEYIWIGLILYHFGRKEGLNKLFYIINKFTQLSPNSYLPKLSNILKLPPSSQSDFYNFIKYIGAGEALSSLTIIHPFSYSKLFSENFFLKEQSIEDRLNKIIAVLEKILDPQSNDSTDIRFIIIYSIIAAGKIRFQKDIAEKIKKYPLLDHQDEEMKSIRGIVRASEVNLTNIDKPDKKYINYFWECISEMTECDLFPVKFKLENRDIDEYFKNLTKILLYLSNLQNTYKPLNEKMTVLLGISTYSFKRFKELKVNKLFNSISGRSCIRVMIENYIMMKYLLKNEKDHENIWRDFQLYGIALYKLVLAKHREKVIPSDSHFDKGYIEALVNEFVSEEFINIDTKYFDKQNIRAKAESVDEKDLYGLYYDYDSSFEHGLWGGYS